MKSKAFLLVVSAIVLVSMIPPASVFASDTQSDMQIARIKGEEFISNNTTGIGLDWQGAGLLNGTAVYDLQAQVMGYLFEIRNGDRPAGYITIGNFLYTYDVLEAIGGGTSPLKNMAEAKSILSSGAKWVNERTPNLVYLGCHQYYDVYISNQ